MDMRNFGAVIKPRVVVRQAGITNEEFCLRKIKGAGLIQ